jgi:hypothetical protein
MSFCSFECHSISLPLFILLAKATKSSYLRKLHCYSLVASKFQYFDGIPLSARVLRGSHHSWSKVPTGSSCRRNNEARSDVNESSTRPNHSSPPLKKSFSHGLCGRSPRSSAFTRDATPTGQSRKRRRLAGTPSLIPYSHCRVPSIGVAITLPFHSRPKMGAIIISHATK